MDWIVLVLALIQVESGGNNQAIGDGGKSVGCLQIQAAVVEDVNRVYATHYKHSQMTDRGKAIEVCRLYLAHYGKAYTKRTGKAAGYEILARIWNGGPAGYRKAATYKYWQRVKEEIKNVEEKNSEGNH